MRKTDISQLLLYVAWLVSIIATLGSLYFSEIQSFIPCELCWYQRILVYPLVLILGIATFQNDKSVKKYVLPISIIGSSISLFHYLEQKVPGFAEIKPCANGVPCSTEYINWLGFITIPFLALIAFSLVSACMLLVRK
ncbi:disulfide oxidoreductase [Macrococcoides canis]|uniref:disulfide oxidoreductase n=1 Tax=Macrococcoides canis TaxID=1855823 RepID=UPI0010FBDA34|nr:disulfide oxidoreductase [Macrococcus canis]MCO4097487.1 disulfide bond formation protein B [Macrococcus canis]QCT75433.1 disulfide bond formation protein B [Macrococcus canis]UTH02030.1 disulfide bond formation protein B [Macrococcus canis]UTH08811.1 disulfide bond formation protein B [Macrococcus canis]